MTSRWVALAPAALVLAAVVVLTGTTPAGACSCVGYTDVQAFHAAEVVFTGRLVSTSVVASDPSSSLDPERFVFDVESVFKGDAAEQQTVVTARDGASCGLEISGPGPFLVFAAATADHLVGGLGPGELSSGLCSGTRALGIAALPAAFGRARPAVEEGAVPGAPSAAPSSSGSAPWWLVAVGGGALAVALGLVIRRRGRADRAQP